MSVVDLCLNGTLFLIKGFLVRFLNFSKFILFLLLFSSLNTTFAEIIAAYKVKMYTFGVAFTFNDDRSIMEDTWQEACIAKNLQPVDLPNASYCINGAGNAVYLQGGDICADGAFKIPANFGWCNEIIAECPNSTWTLSEDKNTCFRPDDACWKDVENVSEVKLLAAIAYGESYWSDVYEEMAGIASAAIRRRDAARLNSMNELVKRNRSFSYVVYDGNERFIKLMCGDEKKYVNAYKAAENAINYGEDYSNGGCFWDGYDLKTSGVKHYKYRKGFRYSDPSHNIFSAPEPPHINKNGDKGGYYDNIYRSRTNHILEIGRKLSKSKRNNTMQVVKTCIWILIILGLIKPVFAIPPFQILRTCIDGKPYDNKLTMLELDDAGAADKLLDNCIDQYELKFNNHTYGSLNCSGKFYLIINDKKIDPELSDNRSINPEIKPGVEFTPRAIWYKIDFKSKEYLCILAPLAEQGKGAAYNQYYIVENAFDVNSNPELYFYFLDKNIAPITSKTL